MIAAETSDKRGEIAGVSDGLTDDGGQHEFREDVPGGHSGFLAIAGPEFDRALAPAADTSGRGQFDEHGHLVGFRAEAGLKWREIRQKHRVQFNGLDGDWFQIASPHFCARESNDNSIKLRCRALGRSDRSSLQYMARRRSHRQRLL